ncbi:MAG TPA: M15 family metallopeptidase [Nannocystis sp.]
MLLAVDSGPSDAGSDGPARVRARRGRTADGAERDEAASFAAVLMTVQTLVDTPPEAVRIDTSLDRLDPEFRRRLERVMERMRNEYGHEVRLVEGFRNAARQEYLYAKGRTRPGPIVTWTLDSAHRHGRAADLLVDGRYDNPDGYARLAQVAREEGLRTLGPVDAGHVELPRQEAAVRAVSEATAPRASDAIAPQGNAIATQGDAIARPGHAVARPATPAAVASVAPVAVPETASVARVAAVAQVAPVARAGQLSRDGAGPGAARDEARVRHAEPRTGAELGAGPGSAARGESAARAMSAASAESTTSLGPAASDSRAGRLARVSSAATRRGDRQASRGVAAAEAPDAGAFDPSASRGADAAASDVARRGAAPGSVAAQIDGAAGAGEVERVAQVLELQEAAAAAPRSTVVLRFEDADGGAGRIRLDLRGTAVNAEISTPDAQLAARLDSQIGALEQALKREGLVPETLRAHAASVAESGDAARLAFTGHATPFDPASSAGHGGAADRDRRQYTEDPARDAYRHDAEERRRSPEDDRHERGRPW